MKKITIIIFLILISHISFEQEEYFVQINPANCNYTIIDSIPGVKWIALSQSTFDKINGRYIFRGEDTSSSYFLYNIDATNGHIVSNPQFPGNFGDIRFDNSSGILYGLGWSSSITNTYFISINPANFNYTIISNLNLTSLGNDAVIDEINNRFIFTAGDSSGNNCLFSLDASTGSIISKPQISTPNFMGYFAFDNSMDILYGIRWSSTPSKSTFISINPVNLNYTIIDTIPFDLSGGIAMSCPTINEINNQYTFSAEDSNSNNYLYTIDLTNGHVIYAPHFPPLVTPYNLIETKYDNSTGTLYALHWGPINEYYGIKEGNDINNNISVYPNPATDNLIIVCSQKATIEISNIEGQLIETLATTGNKTTIDISVLASGMYFIKVRTEKGVTVKKFIKE